MSTFKKYFDSPSRKNQENLHFSIIDDLVLHDLTCLNESKKLDKQMLLVSASKLNVNSQDEDYGGRTALHIGCQKGNFLFMKILKIMVIFL